MSDNYSHNIDATDNQEVLPPEYQQHLDKQLRVPDYEKWLDGVQPGIRELDEMGEEYEHQRPF